MYIPILEFMNMYVHLYKCMYMYIPCTYTFMCVCNIVNMYIHVCTMFRHVRTVLPILVQVVRIPDAHILALLHALLLSLSQCQTLTCTIARARARSHSLLSPAVLLARSPSPRSLAPSLPRSLAPSLPRSLAPSLLAPSLPLSLHLIYDVV
jgi:hypothetical protein